MNNVTQFLDEVNAVLDKLAPYKGRVVGTLNEAVQIITAVDNLNLGDNTKAITSRLLAITTKAQILLS